MDKAIAEACIDRGNKECFAILLQGKLTTLVERSLQCRANANASAEEMGAIITSANPPGEMDPECEMSTIPAVQARLKCSYEDAHDYVLSYMFNQLVIGYMFARLEMAEAHADDFGARSKFHASRRMSIEVFQELSGMGENQAKTIFNQLDAAFDSIIAQQMGTEQGSAHGM